MSDAIVRKLELECYLHLGVGFDKKELREEVQFVVDEINEVLRETERFNAYGPHDPRPRLHMPKGDIEADIDGEDPEDE